MSEDNDICFRTYCGVAGDLQELLIGETSTGIEASRLYTRSTWYTKWRLSR